MPDALPRFRRAQAEDVPAIVLLLADDPLGRTRDRDETPLPPSYLEAAAAIDRDPNDELVVACRDAAVRSEEHTSELQSHLNLVCRLLLEKKKKKILILSVVVKRK